MKVGKIFILAAVTTAVAFAAVAEEQSEQELTEVAQPRRWRVSAGARLAPKVKTTSGISSRAVIDVAGWLRGANGSSHGLPMPSGSSSTKRNTEVSISQTSERVPVSPTSRFEFENGFIDMNDTTVDPNETWYWHFDDRSAFEEARGSIAITESSTTRSSESSSSQSSGRTVSSTSSRSTLSESTGADITSSRESDVWGGELEVGYDFWRGGRFSLGIGLGATLYRSDDAIRAAGRCYSAKSSTSRETASGRVVTKTGTTVDTTTTTTETTTFTDANFAYAGSLYDIRNDDGSIGAGTPDGRTNPYGGNNPVLTLSDGSSTKDTRVETRRDTTIRRTEVFESLGSSSSKSSSRRTIDVAAEGKVELRELRLALQPAWNATDWLELRGLLGAAATRISVDADATVLVNGTRFATVSGDDSGWVFSGLCGLDLVFRPVSRVEVFIGGDVRLGCPDMDYSAGLVSGNVELARTTFRAGVGIAF